MYSGPGGLAVGASNVSVVKDNINYSFSHSWATDWDADTCETYSKNISNNDQDVLIYKTDIRELDIRSLTKTDGFMYGFPCNDFSIVGETKGLSGKYGPLYSYGIEYINHANPLFFLAENVGGLSSANKGKAFQIILNSLSKSGDFGYNLTTHLFKFEDYGVPQARHRYIIIGIRKDLKTYFKVPKPSMEIITARQAIENPPIKETATNNKHTKQSTIVKERLSYIKPGQNAWNADLPSHLKLNVKGAKLSQIYKRLDPKKPAYTVTGSGGGGTHVYHWKENRALTNRERARLQTFPDNFTFYGGKESVRKQIGMAVPPKGAQIILDAVLKSLLNIDYDFIAPSKGYL